MQSAFTANLQYSVQSGLQCQYKDDCTIQFTLKKKVLNPGRKAFFES